MSPREVPTSINELVIEQRFLRDPTTKARVPDDALEGLRDAMLTSRQSAERASRATEAILRNQMKTMAARQKQAKDESWKLFEQGTRKLDTARQRAEQTVAGIRAAIAAPQRQTSTLTAIIDGEVRARLAAMSRDERRRALGEAIRLGDDDVVAAALAGPAMLSGFADRAEREELRAQWQTAAHPEELDRIRRIEQALADVERAGSLLLTFNASLTDAKVIAEAEESERAAQAALSG